MDVSGFLLRTVIVVEWEQIVGFNRVIFRQKTRGLDETGNGPGGRLGVTETHALHLLFAVTSRFGKSRLPNPPGSQEAVETRVPVRSWRRSNHSHPAGRGRLH